MRAPVSFWPQGRASSLDGSKGHTHIAVSGSDPGRPQAQAMVKSETSTDLGILPVGGNADPVFYGLM